MPVFTISQLAQIFIKERTGDYLYCDYYEPGYGYLFTSFGGKEVIVLNDRKNTTLDEQYRNEAKSAIIDGTASSNGLHSSIWNFTELEMMIKAKCNGTYFAVGEYQLDGMYEWWIELDFPW